MANRAEMERALREGGTVHVNGRDVFEARHLPNDPEDGPPVEGVVTHEGGKLTRAGMEHAIAQGGSVLIHNDRGPDLVVTRVEDLPDEADLAAGDERRLAAHQQALDAQIEKLTTERARVTAAAEQARSAPKAEAPRAAEHGHGKAHGHHKK